MDAASHPRSERIGRRSFLARAAAYGVGVGAEGLLLGSSAGAASETTQKRDLVVLQASDITGLDPAASIYTSDGAVRFNLYDTLVRRHPDGTLHPALATAWRRTAATTWEFTPALQTVRASGGLVVCNAAVPPQRNVVSPGPHS
jgi:ABC-type transport system substrate-binding protein